MSNWTRQPSGLVVVTVKLLELQMRFERLELLKKLQRSQLVLQALARGPHGK